jgi:hypothetical protein
MGRPTRFARHCLNVAKWKLRSSYVDASSHPAVPSYAGASTDGFLISRDARGRARGPAGFDTITPSLQPAATSRASTIDWTSRDACIWMTVRWKAMGRTLAPR